MSITITGIDAKTDLSILPDNCEVAFLFTETPEGRKRYPSRYEIRSMLEKIKGRRTALHVCGYEAKRLLYSNLIPDLTNLVQRIQINGKVSINNLSLYCDIYPDKTIITQVTETKNRGLIDIDLPNHSLLIDASAGRGKRPDTWKQDFKTDKPVGFAGGLGFTGLETDLEKISKIAKHGWWIDMETSLRDPNDWLHEYTALCTVDLFNEVKPKFFS